MDANLLSMAVVAGPILMALGLAYGLLKWSNRSPSPS